MGTAIDLVLEFPQFLVRSSLVRLATRFSRSSNARLRSLMSAIAPITRTGVRAPS